MNILVSACLLGVACRYDGTDKEINDILELSNEHTLIPICPEQLGGLSTPRNQAEIVEGIVYDKEGNNVNEQFERGAKETLKLAELNHCTLAILKEKSPSCGYGKIYDGTFHGNLVEGNGKAADLLDKAGIKVIGETKVKDYFEQLANQ